ncbi:MAG: pre-peptidase C-terminal domain-containing protein [Verrucomicrobia bacterium]|nr:pre-peptidase C-terminal domain-containing protein [Verrucomicrobiota bacterium]
MQSPIRRRLAGWDRKRAGSVAALFASLATTALAVDPHLNSIAPPGAQRGTETELRFNGARLDDAQEILFHNSGFEVLKITEAKADHIVAKVKLAADCRLGEHLVRIRTATGISSLQTLHVSPFPQVEEVEPNIEPEKAQKVALNVTVNGHITNEDVDYYRIGAKKGQRLSAEIEGMRIARGMFDPFIAILDAAGNVISRADDTALALQDGAVTVIAPADGEYLVQVRETSFGGNNNPYRLHIGNFPRPTAVYPAGGKAGEPLQVKFLGDAAGEFAQTVTLPATPTIAADRKHPVFAEQNGLSAPSPNYVRVSPFPNVLETEPNDDPQHATATTQPLPLALNGIIEKDGDVDWFRFHAAKGQVWEVNVFARRLRSPLDSVLTITDANGSQIASNDDSGGPDSYLRFNVPRDGDYMIKVTDQLSKGGPDYIYRAELAPITPAVTVYLPDTARYDTQTRKMIVVARGNRFVAMLNARRSNFGGDLAFSADGLPAGLTMQAEPMPSGLSAFPVLFEAKPDALIAGKLLNLTATATKAEPNAKPVSGGIWQNYDLVQQGNDGVFYMTHADKIAVAVVDELPFKVSLVEPKATLPRAGSLNLKVVAERKAGFKEPINVKMLFNPPGVGSLPDMTIPADATSVDYTVNANGDAEVRAWKICVLASAKVKEGTAYTSSQFANLQVAEPFVVGKLDKAMTIRGEPVKVACKLEQKTAFDGKVTVRLLGLPPGATTGDKQITKDDKEVVFDVATAPTATKGYHKTLFCSATIIEKGETVTQTVASGGLLRIDVPKSEEPAPKPAAAPPKKIAAQRAK